QSLLIIDDNPAHLQLLQRLLGRLFPRFKIVGISTIREVSDLAAEITAGFNCVVCDYDLGKYNAVDLLKAVNSKHPPVVVISSLEDESIEKLSLAAGASSFIKKSV